tara:strand:- start:850 stop:1440 length:591 start_codon:yes stop_codon:yes gene_type:complete
LNDPSKPPRPAAARPLADDPPLDFLCAAAADIGVGSNAGGEFDAPVNESPLHTSGIELNDGSSESADFRLVDRPLDRRRGAAPSDASEFLFDCLVDLDDEALPCVRARRASCHQSVEVSIARASSSSSSRRALRGNARSVGRSHSSIHPSRARRRACRRASATETARTRARDLFARCFRARTLFVASLSAGMSTKA